MESKNWVKLRTVIGIILVMFLGCAGVVSEYYPKFLFNIGLSNDEPKVDYLFLGINFFLIFGGAYFQKVAESISIAISTFVNKFKS